MGLGMRISWRASTGGRMADAADMQTGTYQENHIGNMAQVPEGRMGVQNIDHELGAGFGKEHND